MTSILAELQEQYAARAAVALIVPPAVVEAPQKRRATRTYSGAALERRRAWGRFYGALNAEHARKLRAGEVGS